MVWLRRGMNFQRCPDGHERAYAVVNQLAERVDRDGVATLGHGLGCLQGLE